MSAQVYFSNERDPHINQTIEETVFHRDFSHGGGEHVPPSNKAMMVWQNDPAVFIGRNQVPWFECRLLNMWEDAIPLCRRISGGGAVYHDKHTISMSYIVDRKEFNRITLVRFLQSVCQSWGAKTFLDNRQNIFLEPKTSENTGDDSSKLLKIGGSAFRIEKGRALHHVSLLFDSNAQAMWKYLRYNKKFLSPSGGTESQRSSVGSLCEYSKSLANKESKQQDFLTLLINSAQEFLDARVVRLDKDIADTAVFAEKTSRKWILGMTPRHTFDAMISGIPYRFTIASNNILTCENILNGEISSGTIGSELFKDLPLTQEEISSGQQYTNISPQTCTTLEKFEETLGR